MTSEFSAFITAMDEAGKELDPGPNSGKKWTVDYQVTFGKRGSERFYAPVHFADDPATINYIKRKVAEYQADHNCNKSQALKQIFWDGLTKNSEQENIADTDLKIIRKEIEIEQRKAKNDVLYRLHVEMGEEPFLKWANDENIDVSSFMDRIINFEPVEDFNSKVKSYLKEILFPKPLHVNEIKEKFIEAGLDSPDHQNWETIKKIAQRERYTKNDTRRGYWGL